MVTGAQTLDALRHRLEARHLTAWTVALEQEMGARMSVDGSKRLVRVRADAEFTQGGSPACSSTKSTGTSNAGRTHSFTLSPWL